jgi:CMP-N-acetylneuraminic acid synthetase
MDTPFALNRLAIYEMPGARSVDIDTEEDLALAEFWLSHAHQTAMAAVR